jgi:preprotein translocase subunit SecF
MDIQTSSSTPSYFRFMKYKWFYFGFSLFVLIPGIISLLVFKLQLSIDFTGGTLLEIQTAKPVTADALQAVAKKDNLELATVQSSSANTYLLRFKPLTQDENNKFQQAVSKTAGKVTEKSFQTVGPVIGAELTRNALLAVAIASLFIIIYVSWSFGSIPKPYSAWKFGASAVIALLHDVFVVVGLFSIFGHLWGVEVDSLFVTAILTVIGFSVHDTIVVFDRVRENLPKMPKATFEQIVDFSLTETLARSLNTSLTVILTLTALILFGGDTIRWFVAALLIGIISGTYSSIFNAAPILVLWENSKKN